MKVTEVELIPFALPFGRPYASARGTLERRGAARAPADRRRARGAQGGGAADPAPGRRLGHDRALPASSLPALPSGGPLGLLRHRPAARSRRDVHPRRGGAPPAGPAKSALEMALFDLAGKASGKPVWALLGASEAIPVRCNATLVAAAPDEVAADARRWAALGFRTFKLKSAPATTSPRCGRSARRSGPRRSFVSTPTAPGASRRRSGSCGWSSPSTWSWSSSPWPSCASSPR